MAITYTWSVTDMKARNETIDGVTYDNTVIQTFWTKTGTDENGNTGMFAGATPFTYSGTGTFTPYEDLTEEQVLGWIQAEVVGRYAEHVDAQIQKQIDEKANPINDPGLPWAPAPEPEPTP